MAVDKLLSIFQEAGEKPFALLQVRRT